MKHIITSALVAASLTAPAAIAEQYCSEFNTPDQLERKYARLKPGHSRERLDLYTKSI